MQKRKLIRDNLATDILAREPKAKSRIDKASSGEFEDLIVFKLLEEVREVIEAFKNRKDNSKSRHHFAEECADVLTVLCSMGEILNVDLSLMMDAMLIKDEVSGRFRERYTLTFPKDN